MAARPAAPITRLVPHLVLQSGHSGAVSAVAWSPDGRLVATAGADHSVRVWDAETNVLRAVIQEEEAGGGFSSLSFSPDSARVGFTMIASRPTVWDLATGEIWHPPAGPSPGRSADAGLTFLPDGHVITFGYSGAIVWDLASRREIRAVETSNLTSGVVGSHVVDPSGRSYAVALRGGVVELLSLETGVATQHSTALGDARVLRFSDDGELLAVSDATDSGFHVYSTSPWVHVAHLPGAGASIAFAPDRSRIATAGAAGAVRLWDGSTYAMIREHLSQHAGHVSLASFSRDGTRWMSAAPDARGLAVWRADDGERVDVVNADALSPWISALAPDGRRVVIAGSSLAALWVPGNAPASTLLQSRGAWSTAVALLPDATLISGGADGSVRAWDMETLRQSGARAHYLGVDALAVSGDGRTVVSRSFGADVRAWSTAPLTPMWQLDTYPGASVVAIASAEPVVAFASARDGALHTVDAATGAGRAEADPDPEREGVMDLAIAPDGGLVAAYAENTIRIWAPGAGAVTRPTRASGCVAIVGPPFQVVAEGPDGGLVSYDRRGAVLHRVTSPAFPATWANGPPRIVRALASRPGRAEAAVLTEGCIATWDLSNGAPEGSLSVLACDREARASVRYSRDGRLLFASRYDHAIEVWDASAGTLLETVRLAEGPVHDFDFDPSRRVVAVADASIVLGRLDDAGRIQDGVRLVTVDVEGGPFALALASDGRFAGDERAQELVWYRLGEDVARGRLVRASDLYFSFHTPDLVEQFWDGAIPPAPAELGAGVSEPPRLRWIGEPHRVGRTTRVRAEVEDAGGGAIDPAIVVDGMRSPSSVRTEEGRLIVESDLRLAPGPHVVEAYAFGSVGRVRGRSAPLAIEGASTDDPRVLRALVVTVDRYRDPTLRLQHRGDDGDAIEAALGSLRGHPFDDVEVVRLRDAGATRDAVLAAASALAERTTPSDTFVVYLAAHGMSAPCGGDEAELRVLLHGVSRDASTRCSEAVSAEELGARVFEPVRAGHELLLLDACEAGGALTGAAGPGRAIRNLSYLTGFPVIAASRAGTIAHEYDALGHGALTYAVLEALRGEPRAHDADGRVTSSSLGTYVASRVPSISAAHADAMLQAPVVSRGRVDFVLRSAEPRSSRGR